MQNAKPLKDETSNLVGLANLGNTCFLNSCLQVLNHTYELNAFLGSKHCQSQKKDIDDVIMLNEYSELQKLMYKTTGVISPNKFVHCVQNLAHKKNRDLFTGWAQNDISEFLLFMFDCLHNSVSRTVPIKINGVVKNQTDEIAKRCYEMLQQIYSCEYSEIIETFYGIYYTKILSLDKSKNLSVKPEHYFLLDLQIFHENKNCANIYDCFDLFVQPEVMSGENAWYNEKTKKKEDVYKQISFWNLPHILIIILKRFSIDGIRKIQTHVDFPITGLDLSKYVDGYKSNNVYDLYGVCNHMGGIMGGHYTAYVKKPSGKWVHHNDTRCSQIDPDKVVSPNAYCLFYRKKNI